MDKIVALLCNAHIGPTARVQVSKHIIHTLNYSTDSANIYYQYRLKSVSAPENLYSVIRMCFFMLLCNHSVLYSEYSLPQTCFICGKKHSLIKSTNCVVVIFEPSLHVPCLRFVFPAYIHIIVTHDKPRYFAIVNYSIIIWFI